jgi:peroxiredoxin
MATILVGSVFNRRPLAFAEPGNPAPAFKLRDIDGRALTTDDLRGTVTVLYFTSTHCPDSAAYHPRVHALAHRYRNDTRVKFFAVNVDPTPDPLTIRVDAKIVGRSFPTLVDDKAQVAAAYSIKKTPEIAVIGPNGTLRYRGPFDDSAIESQVHQRYVADTIARLVNNPELVFANAIVTR